MDKAKSLFDISTEELYKTLDTLRQNLNKLGFNDLELGIDRWANCEKDITQGGQFIVEGMLSYNLSQKFKENEAEIIKILAAYGKESVRFDVQFGYLEGEKFPSLANLTYVPTQETGKVFECPTGEVVLVDFWAIWCGPCQGPMQHNQGMLEKNQDNWKGKVRIVAVSFDKDVESVIKRVEEKKWDKMEHYYAPGGFRSPLNEGLRLTGIPRVFLMDKKGRIRYKGHPAGVNLEEKIEELIVEDENDGVAEIKNKNEDDRILHCTSEGCSIVNFKPCMSYNTESEHLETFIEKHEAHKHLLDKIEIINSRISANRRFKPNGREALMTRIQLNGKIAPQDKPAVNEYCRKVILPFSSDFDILSCLDVDDCSFNYRYGISCAICKKSLGKGTPHYLCTLCQCEGKQDCAFCLECADKEYKKDIKSGKDLFHPHGLLLLNEDSDKELGSLRRALHFVDIVPDDDPRLPEILAQKDCLGFECHNCEQSIRNYRWACANCDDFDYCPECFEASKDPNYKKHKLNEERGHDKSHLFYKSHYLMTLYPNVNRYEFPVTFNQENA